MPKTAGKESGIGKGHDKARVASPNWVAVSPLKEAEISPEPVGSLEVQVGFCVVKISSGFDKPLLAEVCRVLLSLR